jgi:VWFA-related protein
MQAAELYLLVTFGAQLSLFTGICSTTRVCGALFLSLATAALAQQTQPAPLAPITAPPPLRIEMSEGTAPDSRMPDPSQGLIRLDVAVTDKAGKAVPGLSEKDFTLLDNNQQQKIVTFQAFNGGIQPASSFEVVLVIDELNMLANIQAGKIELSAANREVATFLRAHRGVLQHPAIIYRLTDHGLFATPHASTDGNELADELEEPGRLHQIWPPSAIKKDIVNISVGGAVSARISQSLVALGSIAIEERRKPGRKLMFWIGNGWQIENRRASGISDFSIELLTRMREARINLWGSSEWPLYDAHGNGVPVSDYAMKEFLGGPKPDSTDFAYLSLPVIAARSGGGMLDTSRNLAALIEERVHEESRYYSITFDPPRTSVVDEYHHLQIELNQADITAHSFKDYYNEPVFYDQPPTKQSVTVRELEALIANTSNISRSELEHRLEGVRLTERLASSKLAKLGKDVRGSKGREMLEVVADESVFLAPPADEVLSTPPPDTATQGQIIAATISYINTTVPKLPDFLATRTTVQYHELPPKPNQTWKTATGDESLHQGETTTATLRFHDGKERVENQSVTSDQSLDQGETATGRIQEYVTNAPQKSGMERLQTIGTFGPILVAVMTAARLPQSELKWARWEQSENGPLAVFRYRVPRETPFFFAEFCCLAHDFDTILFKKAAPFHGEIAVNPSTGAILRLTIQADLEWRLPLERSDVMVEYRPVVKGTRTFICPSRSVSISRQRRTMVIREWGEGFRIYAPYETLLNEMRFEKYHIFGSTSRILPGFVEVPKDK